MHSLLAYLLTIGVLITAHEYGHYRVAVACGVRVFRFSWGIGPVVWSRRFGRDGCEFALSALPLGGYVMMLEKPDESTPPEDVPRALNQRPLWQRAAVILAGPMANFLLAVVLFAGAQWNGIEEVAPVFSGPPAGSLLAEAGVRSGDRVVAVSQDGDDADDWDEVNSFDDVYEAIAVAMMDQRPLQLQVRGPADSGAHTLSLPLDSLGKTELDADAVVRIGLTAPFARPVLGRLLPEGPASRAGLHTGDLVLSVDGREIDDAQQLRDRIRASAADGQARTLR